MALDFNQLWIGKCVALHAMYSNDSIMNRCRLLSHPEVSDDPEEEVVPPQALGTASASTDVNEDEGKSEST